MADPNPAATEIALQRLVTVYIVTGLLFLLLPGTFLGVWNLVSISGRHSLAGLSPSWLQAHGHAQIFGWIGTFIIGIGYYSLAKMGRLMPFAVSRGWASWALWTSGVTLRWVANISEWNWRVLLPASAALQLIGFLIFFATVSGHQSRPAPGADRGAHRRDYVGAVSPLGSQRTSSHECHRSLVASLPQSAGSAIYATLLTEPSSNLCCGRGLRVREPSCRLVEIGKLRCHNLAAVLAAAIVVPDKVRQEVEHDAGNEQRCLDGKIATVARGADLAPASTSSTSVPSPGPSINFRNADVAWLVPDLQAIH